MDLIRSVSSSNVYCLFDSVLLQYDESHAGPLSENENSFPILFLSPFDVQLLVLTYYYNLNSLSRLQILRSEQSFDSMKKKIWI